MPHYKAVKNSLVNILKDEADRIIIQKAVVAVHRIIIHTLQFMKLYFLSASEMPKIDEHFVMCCTRVVRETKLDGRTKNREEHQKLADFFDAHYKPTISGDANPAKRRRITSVYVEACTTRERLFGGSELSMPFFSFLLCNSLSQLKIHKTKLNFSRLFHL
jgi:hypothetical protein